MGIAFNNRMLLPSDFIDILQENRLRALEDKDAFLPMIEIISEPGEESNADKLGLNWVVTAFTEKSIEFKIIYENPLEVS